MNDGFQVRTLKSRARLGHPRPYNPNPPYQAAYLKLKRQARADPKIQDPCEPALSRAWSFEHYKIKPHGTEEQKAKLGQNKIESQAGPC